MRPEFLPIAPQNTFATKGDPMAIRKRTRNVNYKPTKPKTNEPAPRPKVPIESTSGNCPKCDGTGKFNGACSLCGGTGHYGAED
jgi:hypothetical protein